MNQYKQLYARGLKTYAPKFKKELQAQVDTFVRTQDYSKISSKGISDTLYSLHLAMGIPMAQFSYKSVKKGLKSHIPDEHKSFLTDLWNNVIIRYLNYRGLADMVQNITDTTKEQIRRFIIKGTTEGLTLNQTIKNLKTAGITDYRAALIARTETGRAANTGSLVGAISTGIQTNKIWISTLDSRTRIIPPDKFDHWNMDRIEIPIDENFQVYSLEGTDYMMYPCDLTGSAGNTCNCRCTIGYRVVKDENNDYISYQDSPPMGDAGKIWSLLTDNNNNNIYNAISKP